MKIRLILFFLGCTSSIYSMEADRLVPPAHQPVTATDIFFLSNIFQRTHNLLRTLQLGTVGWAIACVAWAAYRAENLWPWETIALLGSMGVPSIIIWLTECCMNRDNPEVREILERLQTQFSSSSAV